jgi:hypothetical protein
MNLEEIFEVIRSVSYKDWIFFTIEEKGKLYLQVRFEDENSHQQNGRKWYLSTHMTKSEIVSTIFKAVLTAEEHEVREKFKYKDANIYSPHYNVDALLSLHRASPNTFDVRGIGENKPKPYCKHAWEQAVDGALVCIYCKVRDIERRGLSANSIY